MLLKKNFSLISSLFYILNKSALHIYRIFPLRFFVFFIKSHVKQMNYSKHMLTLLCRNVLSVGTKLIDNTAIGCNSYVYVN